MVPIGHPVDSYNDLQLLRTMRVARQRDIVYTEKTISAKIITNTSIDRHILIIHSITQIGLNPKARSLVKTILERQGSGGHSSHTQQAQMLPTLQQQQRQRLPKQNDQLQHQGNVLVREFSSHSHPPASSRSSELAAKMDTPISIEVSLRAFSLKFRMYDK
ncbi:unnamed protein product [Protopolystoma xenopodis]|uniref:Uncharacterized protein n=1 Tax=Protopolystoma xenopodis TaxID=117903 RepID=A0A448WVG2_9PLAT|nr:unnamed protein product [Protopolystoma xenopodis]